MFRFMFLLISIGYLSISLCKGEKDVNFLVVFEDGAQVTKIKKTLVPKSDLGQSKITFDYSRFSGFGPGFKG